MAELGAIVPDTGPAPLPDGEPLTGRHVKLRRMEESDFPKLWSSIGAHDEIFYHWPEGPYPESSQFINSLKELGDEKDLLVYTVFMHEEAVGCLFLLPTDADNRVIEMGALYGPALQKTRGATEAVFLGMCVAFDKLNNRRLAWKTDSMNKPSRRAAERWGFMFEGCLRQHGIQKGRNRDTVWYAIIDSEWLVCKRAFEIWLDDDNFDESGKQKRRLGDIRREIQAHDGAVSLS